MRIKELYKADRPVVSLEVFPPKKDCDMDGVYSALDRMSVLSPDFISVTYGANGGNRSMTAEIASFIRQKCGVRSLAHLTCVGSVKETVQLILDELRTRGVDNVLALRGDIPEGGRSGGSYRYASDLIQDVRLYGGFSIGAACYPEGHIDCDNLNLDTEYLRRKQEAGADFLITQLFFDNDYFFRFMERARAKGVTIPISAGVMPIFSRKQIERMIFMCGASLPSGIIKLLHKYEDNPADLRIAGIEYAAKQLEGLIYGGADGVHIYTMNKPDVAEYCMRHIGRAR